MILYDFARRLNGKRKQFLKNQAGKVLSPVRRIERVHPIPGERLVAMTFDDGPCAKSFSGSDRGLTEKLLSALGEYGARASFDVIGTTGENYPDECGQQGAFTWSGMAYDHYPAFGEDTLAGAMNQPDLVRRILAGGHELTNHSCTHRLFGPMRTVYGSRRHMNTLEEVANDLERLHDYIREEFGYEMKLSRPPHYIDAIPGGGTSYDAYRILGYNYMAASFDGDGWMPADTPEREVENMLRPLRETLERDPDALNGQIIFQKDGCNMSLRTPVEEALPLQLAMLRDYGYRVVPVSELLEISPFEDLSPEDRAMPFVRKLLQKGRTVGYRNNTFHGERPITKEEFCLMAADPERLKVRRHADFRELAALAEEGLGFSLNSASGNALLDLALKAGVQVDEGNFKDKKTVRRADAVELLAGML